MWGGGDLLYKIPCSSRVVVQHLEVLLDVLALTAKHKELERGKGHVKCRLPVPCFTRATNQVFPVCFC